MSRQHATPRNRNTRNERAQTKDTHTQANQQAENNNEQETHNTKRTKTYVKEHANGNTKDEQAQTTDIRTGSEQATSQQQFTDNKQRTTPAKTHTKRTYKTRAYTQADEQAEHKETAHKK